MMVGGALVKWRSSSATRVGVHYPDGVLGQDYILISATTLIITIMVLIANFVIEIIYGFPRSRASKRPRPINGDYRPKHTIRQDLSLREICGGIQHLYGDPAGIVTLYPLIIRDAPLKIIGQGTFFALVSMSTSATAWVAHYYTILLDDAAAEAHRR